MLDYVLRVMLVAMFGWFAHMTLHYGYGFPYPVSIVGGVVVVLILTYVNNKWVDKDEEKPRERMFPGRNVGPESIHESIDGGASELQMELMGGGHHPRCHHYEWGACNCAYLEEKDRRMGK